MTSLPHSLLTGLQILLIFVFFSKPLLASSITGQVTDIVGGGIATVEVEAWENYLDPYSAEMKLTTMTDLNGYYDLSGLAPSEYAIYFNTPNYVSEWYNDQADVSSANPVTIISEASIITDIDAILGTRGFIAGQVTDLHGGVHGIQVEAWTYFFDPYSSTQNLQSTTTTDLNGYYNLPVAEGTYKVNFNENSTGYISEWFDDKADIASADDVPVTEPFTTANVNAILLSVDPRYTVMANATGNGFGMVSSDVGGITYSYQTDNTGTSTHLRSGSSITVTAVANTGSTVAWSDCAATGGTATSATCTFSSLDGDKTVTATFTLDQYTVTADANGNGFGLVSSDVGGISYSYQTDATGTSSPLNHGSPITITANANTGSTVAWSGCESTGGTSISATCAFSSLDASKTVTATFILKQYTLTITLLGKGTGVVTSTPGIINCESTCSDTFDSNTNVTLTAAPYASAQFTGWAGDPDCADGTVTMTTDVNCTANFYSFPWPLFLPAKPSDTQP